MLLTFCKMRFKCRWIPQIPLPGLVLVLCLIGSSQSLRIGRGFPRPASVPDSFRNSTPANTNVTTGDFFNASSLSREARRSIVSGGIFSLISFENVPCNATTGDVGVCYSIRECQNLGGSQAGPCAGSYGTCCVLTAGCGSSITINNTYIVNPGWPSATTGPLSCTITIALMTGVSQQASELYLEYDKFLLDGPSNGTCATDSMVVTVPGVKSTYPVLCGNNTGQNDYISLSGATGSVTITFNLAANSDQRCWKIRVVEFQPTDACAAPAGCTQFLREVSGTIETYNYNGGQGQLLNNYCINICFQAQTGYCNLLLTEGNFQLSGIAPSDCVGDFLLANGMKFCGETLNNGMLQVNCTTSPLMITFCSGASNWDGWGPDLGFSLNYNLLPCVTG